MVADYSLDNIYKWSVAKNFWIEINSRAQTRASTEDYRQTGQVIFPGENEDFFNPARMFHAGDDMEGYFCRFGGGQKGKKIDFPEGCITWES